MGKILSVSVDVSKIDKSRLYKGKKGTYLKLSIGINDAIDQFGNNVSVWEEQTSEERTAKAQKNYLGNGKVVYDSQQQTAPVQNAHNAPSLPVKDELPF